MSYPNGMMGAPALYDSKPQVISADGGEVWLHAPGCAGGVITVDGTFSGTLSLVGAIERGAAEGPRVLFQSGVGSIGRNYVVGYGDAVNREYRFIDGANWLCLRASNWVSGSVAVRIVATHSTAAVFSLGPVHTATEEATRSGRMFTGGLPPTSATSSDVAHIILENPSDSGKIVFLTNRLFGNDNAPSDSNIVYQAYVNPTVDTSTWTTRSAANFAVGGPVSAAEIHTFVGAAVTMGGIQASGEILPNGVPYSRAPLARIDPGVNLGFTVAGSGGGGNASTVSIIFELFEEDLQ